MKLPPNIPQSVQIALEEDIATGDVTADLIPLDEVSKATIICRDNAVLAGCAWLDEAFRQIDNSVIVQWYFKDGDLVDKDTILCRVQGSSRSLLSGERVGLNFLQLLSATATITKMYVKAVEGTGAKILDTRKTIPGLRLAQKYAVLCGGGSNHRIGLYDRVLIKENHIMAAGSISQAVEQAKQLHPDLKIEVETENIAELEEASRARADIIMLDNFSLDDMKIAVALNADNGSEIELEASGGVTLATVKQIAETGVDYISIGEITKDIKAVDLSMRFDC
ncbi:MAG TPA: carboxylating nicotinate-nucleotide diphosphorylase [Thiothrix sp.]|nr:carboxylating nicotinate-nucleotide diphosphorylase [Thiothrix sp.]